MKEHVRTWKCPANSYTEQSLLMQPVSIFKHIPRQSEVHFCDSLCFLLLHTCNTFDADCACFTLDSLSLQNNLVTNIMSITDRHRRMSKSVNNSHFAKCTTACKKRNISTVQISVEPNFNDLGSKNYMEYLFKDLT